MVVSVKTYATTIVALIAFAANSVLCRLALKNESIDPANFTAIRLLSALAMLWLIVMAHRYYSKTIEPIEDERPFFIRWCSSLSLFSYAIFFSFAYLSLDAGVGALLLFVSVQITMLAVNSFQGKVISSLEKFGVLLALVGFSALFVPDIIDAPQGIFSLTGMLMMIVSGISWGIYSVLGRLSTKPLLDSSYNFLRAAPFVIFLLLLSFLSTPSVMTGYGILLAVVSGALASGVGYAVWYSALTGLSSTQGAVVQLTVPIIAAIGGVIFAGEYLSMYVVLCGTVVLLGVFLVNMAAHKVTA